MKLAVFITSAIMAAVASCQLGGFPECSRNCFYELSRVNSCPPLAIGCHCATDQLNHQFMECVHASCNKYYTSRLIHSLTIHCASAGFEVFLGSIILPEPTKTHYIQPPTQVITMGKSRPTTRYGNSTTSGNSTSPGI